MIKLFVRKKSAVYASVLFFVIASFVMLSGRVSAETLPFPLVETYSHSDGYDTYLSEAQQFLDKNSKSMFAPRVAMDVLLVATKAKKTAVVDAMKAKLILDYNESVQSEHALTFFKNAGAYREFLIDLVEKRLDMPPKVLARQFTKALVKGVQHFGQECLKGDIFLLKAHSLVSMSGDRAAADFVLSKINMQPEDAKVAALMKVYFDRELTRIDKVSRLHGKGDDADFIKKLYLAMLSPTERQDAIIVKIAVEDAIISAEYDKAVALLELLPAVSQNDPQVLFWKVLVAFALNKDREAMATLDTILQDHKASPWAKTAQIYKEGMQGFSANQLESVDTIQAVVNKLKSGFGVLQFKATYELERKGGKHDKFTVYGGIIPEDSHLEVMLYKNSDLHMVYSSTNSDSAIYLKDLNKAVKFKSRAPIPTPAFSLSRKESGGFKVKFGLHMSTTVEEAGANAGALFNSPFLSTRVGLQTMLNYVVRKKRKLPLAFKSSGDMKEGGWVVFSTSSPEVERNKYRVSVENGLNYVRSGNFCITELKYGPKDSFKLELPSWSHINVEEHEKFDFTAMMQLMQAIGAMVGA